LGRFSSTPLIGIDLGTSNSAIALWRDGRAELIAGRDGGRLTPSVVGFDHDGRVLVGRAAWERLVTHRTQTVAAFKRRMGNNQPIQLGSRSFSPTELSALVLRKLVDDATHLLREPIREAVISVPA
jgi:molecular chaperone HscC